MIVGQLTPEQRDSLKYLLSDLVVSRYQKEKTSVRTDCKKEDSK